jgi:hypothetical protein
MKPLASVIVGLGIVLSLAGAASAGPIAHLTLQSQPGDFIGQGQNWDITYTPSNSTFFSAQITHTLPSGAPTYLSFLLGTVTGDSSNTFSTLDFSTQQLGIALAPGTYLDAQRAAFATAGHPGLDVTFQNRGSNTLTGQFTVNDVSFVTTGSGLQIESFDVSFEQHSEGQTPALFGQFSYSAGDYVIPEPASLSLCGAGIACVAGFALRRWKGRPASAAA